MATHYGTLKHLFEFTDDEMTQMVARTPPGELKDRLAAVQAKNRNDLDTLPERALEAVMGPNRPVAGRVALEGLRNLGWDLTRPGP